jgi:predicted phosphodiesterase
MADSHGDSEAITAAAAFLKAHGCRLLIHLGDICDSADPFTVASCVAAVREAGILAVRGNNDHALVADETVRLDPEPRAWLAGLPLRIDMPSAVFIHNRPNIRRLGKAALFGDLTDAEALSFLHACPRRILFRGHSHRPSIQRIGPGGLTAAPLPGAPGVVVDGGAVITCGSLDRGTVLMWDTVGQRVTLVERD